MIKHSIVLILMCISMHLSGASPSVEDADVIEKIMGPHYGVLITEGKEAFIDKVCSTWLKEQVQPECLLDVMQSKARKQACDLGFEHHWFVEDMAPCVQDILNTKGEHVALSVLVVFMEYVLLSHLKALAPDTIKELNSELELRQFVFEKDRNHLLRSLRQNCSLPMSEGVYKQPGMIMRFMPYGVLPMAEFLALYSRGFVPMPLVECGVNNNCLEWESIIRTDEHFRAIGNYTGFLQSSPRIVEAGIEKAWSDIMGASGGVEQMFSVFLHYQLHYERGLEALHSAKRVRWFIAEYVGHIGYFQRHGVLDADEKTAREQAQSSCQNLVRQIVS